MNSNLFVDYYQSPLGTLRITGTEEKITNLDYLDDNDFSSLVVNTSPFIKSIISQLDEYFQGKRRDFDVSLFMSGTAFQQQVWQELTRIPYGQTISYAQLANKLGNPRAMRAVGNANGKNPIPIIVPCHRVIATGGGIGGYSGGLDKKSWLLAHEQRILSED